MSANCPAPDDLNAPFINAMNAMMEMLDLPAEELAKFRGQDEHGRSIGFNAAMRHVIFKATKKQIEVANHIDNPHRK